MADDNQWVAVFADISGNNLDEFVRCVCIEGPDQFTENLKDKDRSFQNFEYLHSLLMDNVVRKAYLVSSDLFDIAMERYRMYVKACMDNTDDHHCVPEYFRENCQDGNIDSLVERDLVFRATAEDFAQMEEEAEGLFMSHGQLVLEELPEDTWREIVSRAYDRDCLVFIFERGECVLRECSFKPFEVAFQQNKQFRAHLTKFVLWAIFSGSLTRLWTQYSHEGGIYATTIEILYQQGKKYIDKFGADLVQQFEDGVPVSGMSIRVRMLTEELLGKEVNKDQVIVPRSTVEYVLGEKASPPFFVPKTYMEK